MAATASFTRDWLSGDGEIARRAPREKWGSAFFSKLGTVYGEITGGAQCGLQTKHTATVPLGLAPLYLLSTVVVY